MNGFSEQEARQGSCMQASSVAQGMPGCLGPIFSAPSLDAEMINRRQSFRCCKWIDRNSTIDLPNTRCDADKLLLEATGSTCRVKVEPSTHRLAGKL
jgi:hypothetical protein